MPWFGRKKVKEEKNAYERSSAEAEQMIADIERSIREVDKLPGAQKSISVASEQAKIMLRELEVERFKEKFNPLGYTEISHELMTQRMGIRKEKAMLSDQALNMLRHVEPSSVMSDFLVPYLLEKEKAAIISEEELLQLNRVRARMDNKQFKKFAGAIALLIAMLLGNEELARKFEVAYGLYVDYRVEKEIEQETAQQEVSVPGRRSK